MPMFANPMLLCHSQMSFIIPPGTNCEGCRMNLLSTGDEDHTLGLGPRGLEVWSCLEGWSWRCRAEGLAREAWISDS